MPSLINRSVDIHNTHVRARPEPVHDSPVHVPQIPTPMPPYLGRHPRMISSLPSIFSTPDAAMRQFYGTRLPAGRVSQT